MSKLSGGATLLALAVGASPSMAQVGSGVHFRGDAAAAFLPTTAFADTVAAGLRFGF